MRTYEDFEVWVSAEGTGFRVRATGAGETQGFDLDAASLSERWQRLATAFAGGSRVHPAEIQDAEALGGELFRAVFTDRILRSWGAALARAQERGPAAGVRLVLHVQEAGPLASLPWELLFDRDHQGLLALSLSTPLIRYPDVQELERPLAARAPLRLLGVLAEPLGQPLLDLEGEWQAIEKALAPLCDRGLVEIERLASPTLPKLRERLKREPTIHALHLAGHGGAGEFVLEANQRIRKPEPALGQQLASLLGDAPELRLVVINACDGASDITGKSTTSLAFHLARRGVPAIVALQSAIGDTAARLVSRELYQEIAKGSPLEVAVTEARRALYAEHKGMAWAAPVLYLRGPGRLILPKFPWLRIILLCSVVLAVAGIALAANKGKHLAWQLTHPPKPQAFAKVSSDPDCPSPRGLDFAFVKIEPGKFTMGAPGNRGDRTQERPAHEVTLTTGFCVSAFEVTEGQWDAVKAARDARTTPRADLPKVGVSWNDAKDFLARLNERDPDGLYRLLTEAEFEYAARAGSSAAYTFGDREEALPNHANCRGEVDGYPERAPIASFEPNPWGLYDVQGNVEEWVADRYGSYSSNGETEVDPKGPLTGTDRVRRGGSFRNAAESCTLWSRKQSTTESRSKDLGFRIARSPVTPPPPLQSGLESEKAHP